MEHAQLLAPLNPFLAMAPSYVKVSSTIQGTHAFLNRLLSSKLYLMLCCKLVPAVCQRLFRCCLHQWGFYLPGMPAELLKMCI